MLDRNLFSLTIPTSLMAEKSLDNKWMDAPCMYNLKYDTCYHWTDMCPSDFLIN